MKKHHCDIFWQNFFLSNFNFFGWDVKKQQKKEKAAKKKTTFFSWFNQNWRLIRRYWINSSKNRTFWFGGSCQSFSQQPSPSINSVEIKDRFWGNSKKPLGDNSVNCLPTKKAAKWRIKVRRSWRLMVKKWLCCRIETFVIGTFHSCSTLVSP